MHNERSRMSNSIHNERSRLSHSRHTDFRERSHTDSLYNENYSNYDYNFRDKHREYMDGENISHLLNAAYFRCRWKKSFTQCTHEDWFFIDRQFERANKTRFMFRQDFFYYRKDIEGRRYIKVNYEKDLYMILVLPPLENFYDHFVNTANVLDIVKSSEHHHSQ